MASSGDLFALAEVSDYESAFPPRLRIYSIGNHKITQMQAVSGPCFSLGSQICSVRTGFIASAPSSAFRWGSPGPFVYRISRKSYSSEQLPFPLIPYGESMSGSNDGKEVILCSKMNPEDCLIISDGVHRKIKSPSLVERFGIATATSYNGSTHAIISLTKEHRHGLHFIKSNGDLINKFEPLNWETDPIRPDIPTMFFVSDKALIVFFKERQSIARFHYTKGSWVLESENYLAFNACTYSNKVFYCLHDQAVKILDGKLVQINEFPIETESNLTQIVAGNDWFAILEDNLMKRRILVYENSLSPFWKWMALITLCGLGFFIRAMWKSKKLCHMLQGRKGRLL